MPIDKRALARFTRAMHRISLPVILLGATACQSASTEHTAPPDQTATTGSSPTPYTEGQIQAAHPNGTLLRFRIVQPTGEVVQHMRFDNGDDSAVDVVSWSEDSANQALNKPTKQRARWSDLRDHASFASTRTVRRRARCKVPAGSYDCWEYVVRGAKDDQPTQRFYFADDKPGPPVLLVTERDGTELMRMELLEYRRGR